MRKILFMIPHLGHGGAEKVLINLVNHMDRKKFDVTVMTLYDVGVNRKALKENIHYKTCFQRSFPGVAHILKLLSPKQLYSWIVKEKYDIVISYLEGQTARIISGCSDKDTFKICWIHRTMSGISEACKLFRNIDEAKQCYNSFNAIVSVSEDVQNAFMRIFDVQGKGIVLHNTNHSESILTYAEEKVDVEELFSKKEFNICAMGSLIPVKGFDRLIRIQEKLKRQGYSTHVWIMGEGKERKNLENLIEQLELRDCVTLLGYQVNPYKYMKNCDMFISCSHSEGYSTAVTEALILGIPVVTTRVSGMEEILGCQNEYGIITDNSEEALHEGILKLLENPQLLEHYRDQAQIRGTEFKTENTVRETEDFFLQCLGEK